MDEKPFHPTYGTLDDLLAVLRFDIESGHYIRIGLQGALNWFTHEYGKLRSQRNDRLTTPSDAATERE